MRKILGSAVVAGLFVVAFAACGGGGGGNKNAFCDLAKSYDSQFSDSTSSADLSDIGKAFHDLAAKAPKEVKGAIETLAKAYDEFLAAKTPAQQQSVASKFESDSDLSAASDTLDSFASSDCGISDKSDGSDKSSSSSSRRSSSSTPSLSDLSDLSSLTDSFTDLSDLSSLSDYFSSLSDAFTDLSDFSDFSDLSDLTNN